MHYDYIVIGGGMAGSSVACELARHARVLLVEQESQPGYHSTGRSAALFSETYGNAVVRALSRAGRAFFQEAPTDFAENALISPRGMLHFGDADQSDKLDALHATLKGQAPVIQGDASLALKLSPLLRPERVAGCVWEPDAFDIDVHAMQQGYLKGMRKAGGVIWLNAPVRAIEYDGAAWRIVSPAGSATATTLVNAAGAWADVIAQIAGVRPIGLVPKRRTAVLFDAPVDADISAWPVTIDVDETFYFKPDAGKLLASPADETPSEACDAQPDEWDIAVVMDRVSTHTTCAPRSISHSWAGLRSFVSDKTPVVGFDEDIPGFFWLAGQGGYGIQCAPALANAAAALMREGELPSDIVAEGITKAHLSPRRLSRRVASDNALTS